MTSNLKDIEKKVLELPLPDRALLAQHLIRSLDNGTDEELVDESWTDEVKKRYSQYKNGKIPEESAEHVFQDAKAHLK